MVTDVILSSPQPSAADHQATPFTHAIGQTPAAESRVSCLEAELGAARPWERRAIRRDLAGAGDRVAEARSRYEDELEHARPALEELEQAGQRLAAVRDETEVELMRQRFDAFGREVPSNGGLSR